MPNLGGPELIWLIIVLVLLFGAKRLPELGGSVGRSIKNFKKGMAEAHAENEDETPTQAPSPKPPSSNP
ncbi:MAG: Sec-independent protein translocase subunit TatA/TatB [Egibacteraceae bacterium]